MTVTSDTARPSTDAVASEVYGRTMPSLPRVARLAASLATGGLLSAVSRSPMARQLGRRAVTDPGGLVRDLADPAKARVLVASASDDPALRQLAQTGLVFLPLRYVPLGYAALWAGRKVLRRYLARPGRATAGETIEVPVRLVNTQAEQAPTDPREPLLQ